jgi:RNA polymerase sigma-70 factor (ECF subfamily)
MNHYLPLGALSSHDNSLLIIFGFVIVIVAIKSFVRLNRQKLWHETVRAAIADEAASAATHAADLRHDLDAAMEQLSPDEQMAVHLFYKQGLSQPEIAEVAGWPLGTVKTHLSRGKEKLRRLLAAWNPQT